MKTTVLRLSYMLLCIFCKRYRSTGGIYYTGWKAPHRATNSILLNSIWHLILNHSGTQQCDLYNLTLSLWNQLLSTRPNAS